jgi:predicted DCC family thiol-disulfide oxidoreductase YuxK
MTFSTSLRKLDSWFFTPTSPTPMALARIFIGLVVLQDLVIHLLPDFALYYGDHAILSTPALLTKYWGFQSFFDLMLVLPSGEHWRLLFFILLIITAFFMTIGLWSRFSMVFVWLGLMSLDSHFELNQNDGDVFLRLAVMILACSNAGDAFSIDNLLRAFRQDWRLTGFGPRLSSPWAQRWLQLQLAFVYSQTFFAKLSGKHWIDGWAVYFASRYDDCQRFMLPVVFDTPFIVKSLTWGTLLIEFSLWTLVWFKELRYWVLLSGILLHMGIEMTMNLPMFEWVIMFSYFAFVEPEDLAKVMNYLKAKIHSRFGAPVLLAFDGNSISCVHAVGVLHRMDIFGFLEAIDFRNPGKFKSALKFDKSDNSIFLQNKKVWLRGFDAFRWLSLRLPILWIIVPFVLIPPFSWLMKQIYVILSRESHLIFGQEQPDKTVAVKSLT